MRFIHQVHESPNPLELNQGNVPAIRLVRMALSIQQGARQCRAGRRLDPFRCGTRGALTNVLEPGDLGPEGPRLTGGGQPPEEPTGQAVCTAALGVPPANLRRLQIGFSLGYQSHPVEKVSRHENSRV